MTYDFYNHHEPRIVTSINGKSGPITITNMTKTPEGHFQVQGPAGGSDAELEGRVTAIETKTNKINLVTAIEEGTGNVLENAIAVNSGGTQFRISDKHGVTIESYSLASSSDVDCRINGKAYVADKLTLATGVVTPSIKTENSSVASTDQIWIKTGDSFGDSDSSRGTGGPIYIETGMGWGSQGVNIKSGPTLTRSTGVSGNISLSTGTSDNGTSGSITLIIGNAGVSRGVIRLASSSIALDNNDYTRPPIIYLGNSNVAPVIVIYGKGGGATEMSVAENGISFTNSYNTSGGILIPWGFNPSGGGSPDGPGSTGGAG
jgi:hypothetical protein